MSSKMFSSKTFASGFLMPMIFNAIKSLKSNLTEKQKVYLKRIYIDGMNSKRKAIGVL